MRSDEGGVEHPRRGAEEHDREYPFEEHLVHLRPESDAELREYHRAGDDEEDLQPVDDRPDAGHIRGGRRGVREEDAHDRPGEADDEPHGRRTAHRLMDRDVEGREVGGRERAAAYPDHDGEEAYKEGRDVLPDKPGERLEFRLLIGAEEHPERNEHRDAAEEPREPGAALEGGEERAADDAREERDEPAPDEAPVDVVLPVLRHHRGDARRDHAGKGGADREEYRGRLGEMVGVEVHEVEHRHHEYAAADSQKPRDQAHRDARRKEARNHLESYALKHDLIPHLKKMKQGNYTAERGCWGLCTKQ